VVEFGVVVVVVVVVAVFTTVGIIWRMRRLIHTENIDDIIVTSFTTFSY
jgi:hypothetical protein